MLFYDKNKLEKFSNYFLKELFTRDYFNRETNETAKNELRDIAEILKEKSFEERIKIDKRFRSHCDAAIKDGKYEIADKDMELRDYFHCKVLD